MHTIDKLVFQHLGSARQFLDMEAEGPSDESPSTDGDSEWGTNDLEFIGDEEHQSSESTPTQPHCSKRGQKRTNKKRRHRHRRVHVLDSSTSSDSADQ